MKGPHRVLVVCSILVLVVVWLLGTGSWRADPPDPGPSASTRTALTSKGPASPSIGLEGEDLREALPSAPSKVEQDDMPSILLRVLEKDGGAPVPESEVHVFYDRTLGEDPDQIRTSGPSTVKQIYHADADGVVHLRTPERYTWVEGYRGDLYGWASFQFGETEPEEGWTLHLEVDHGFDVLAVDSAGQPIAGIPLHAAFRSFRVSSQRVSPTTRWLGVTDAEGLLAIRHTQLWEVFDEYGRKPVELSLQIVGEEDPTVTVDLNDLPRNPVEVVCPATGSIRVHVLDPFGQPWKGGFLEGSPLYGVHVTPMNATGTETEGRYLDDFEELGPGEFFLRNVALGLSYEVRLNTTFPFEWTTRFLGPTRADQEVEVELRPPADGMILQGTLADANGPVGEQGLNLEVETQPDEHSGYAGMARTSQDGRFWFVLDPELRGARLDHVHLDLRSEPLSRYGGITRVPYGNELQPGIHELGWITVAPPPLVVSGRFVHDGRWDTIHTPLSVERLRQRSTDGEWTHVSGLTSSYGLDDSFEVRGEVPAAPLRITVGGNRFVRTEPIEFIRGTTNLEIALQETGTLEIRILHDRLVAPDSSSLVVELRGDDNARYERVSVFKPREEDRKLRWWSLPPGKYRLRISNRAGGHPLADIAGIEVQSGELTELGPLDLRGRLTRARVRVVDGSGAPISNTTVLLRRSASESQWSTLPRRGEEREILLGEDPVDLLVSARDYRFAHVRGVREDTTVTLLPRFEVTVHLNGLGPLPEGIRVLAALHATEDVRAGLPALDPDYYPTSEFADRLFRHSVRDIEDGAVFRLPVAGRFEVRISLRGRRAATLQGVEPGILHVAEMDAQEFRVHIPEKSLQAALERVNR